MFHIDVNLFILSFDVIHCGFTRYTFIMFTAWHTLICSEFIAIY